MFVLAGASPGGLRGQQDVDELGNRSSSDPEAEIGEVHNETLGALSAWPPAAPTQDRWMWEFCSSKCQAAGYCCNDFKIGSNQMISCAQACMMRARGSSLEEMLSANAGGICRRNGRSGCVLRVRGNTYNFCGRCQDLTPSSMCIHGVASSAACDYGASLQPSPEDYCAFRCKAAGYCCNDYRVGSNQMISCAQSCMMRTLGTSWSRLSSWRRGLCARSGRSGCSLAVSGYTYGFCSACQDLTQDRKCRWGVESFRACDYGASLPPSRWGASV